MSLLNLVWTDRSDADSETVHLGAWCVPHAHREETVGTVLEYPLRSQSDLRLAYEQVASTYGRLMPGFASLLNEIHGESFSEQYWEIRAGFWLLQYVERLYERYVVVTHAAELHPDAAVALLDRAERSAPRDAFEFIVRATGDRQNLQLYSNIIEFLGLFDGDRRVLDPARIRAGEQRRSEPWLRRTFKNGVKWASLLAARRTRTFLCSSQMTPANLLAVCIRGRLIPCIDVPHFAFPPSDAHPRRCGPSPDLGAETEFERVVEATLFTNLPRSYLEDFDRYTEAARRFYPSRPKAIVTGNSFAANDGFAAWTASMVEERDVPYVILQHGGTYGCGAYHTSELYERKASSLFVTWGWDDGCEPKVLPFIAGRIPTLARDVRCRRDGKILWILASMPRYSYTLYSYPVGPQFRSYLLQQAEFLAALEESRRDLVCRPYPYDYGWDDVGFIEAQGVPVPRPFAPPLTRICDEVRMVVCTYNGMSHTESMNLNIPTVVYWDPELFPLRKRFEPVFQLLREVGVLHDHPLAAAKHVESIAGDPVAWWSDASVQRARLAYCRLFGQTPPNSGELWHELLVRIAESDSGEDLVANLTDLACSEPTGVGEAPSRASKI